MNDLSNNLTEKQKGKMLNFWRGYSFQCVRNKTIVMILLYTNITPSELIWLKDSNNIIPELIRQVNKYVRIKRIYFDSMEFEYLFLNGNGEQMNEREVRNILHSALRFANVNPDKF